MTQSDFRLLFWAQQIFLCILLSKANWALGLERDFSEELLLRLDGPTLAIAQGDLNSDGQIDAVAIGLDKSLHIYLNLNTPHYQQIDGLVGGGEFVQLKIDDIDGDLRDDIIVLTHNGLKGRVTTFASRFNDNFPRFDVSHFSTDPDFNLGGDDSLCPVDLAIGHFNEDGLKDMIIIYYPLAISVLRNTGKNFENDAYWILGYDAGHAEFIKIKPLEFTHDTIEDVAITFRINNGQAEGMFAIPVGKRDGDKIDVRIESGLAFSRENFKMNDIGVFDMEGDSDKDLYFIGEAQNSGGQLTYFESLYFQVEQEALYYLPPSTLDIDFIPLKSVALDFYNEGKEYLGIVSQRPENKMSFDILFENKANQFYALDLPLAGVEAQEDAGGVTLQLALDQKSLIAASDGQTTAINNNILNYPYKPGDLNEDGKIDVSDVTVWGNFLQNRGPLPPCKNSVDLDQNGVVGIHDFTLLIDFVFQGRSLPENYPTSCGHWQYNEYNIPVKRQLRQNHLFSHPFRVLRSSILN